LYYHTLYIYILFGCELVLSVTLVSCATLPLSDVGAESNSLYFSSVVSPVRVIQPPQECDTVRRFFWDEMAINRRAQMVGSTPWLNHYALLLICGIPIIPPAGRDLSGLTKVIASNARRD
jgi:hypothetical protein